MTNVVIPIRHTSNTIILSVVKSIIKEFLFSSFTGPIENIIYVQRGGKNVQTQNNAEQEPLRLETDEYIKVEYSTKVNTTLFDNDKYQNDYLPIFTNKVLGINLTPMHTHVLLELNITYRSKNYDELTLWLSNYTRNTMRLSESNNHSVLYNLTIPDEVYRYIHDVWKLSEKVAGYGDSFKDFLSKNFESGIGFRANSNDTIEKLILTIKNTACLGIYTSPPPDEPTTSLEPPVSEISFTYTLNFEQPTAILLGYQKVIHNQSIDTDYLYPFADRLLHDDPMKGNLTLSGNAYRHQLNKFGTQAYANRLVNETDGWNPSVIPEGFILDNIIPIQLNLDNLSEIVSLNDIVSDKHPQWLIDLMKLTNQLPVTYPRWFYYIALYEVNENQRNIGLTINEFNNINSNIPLNPRNRHYLCIFKNYRLGTVDISSYRRTPLLLSKIFKLYLKDVTFATLGNGLYITDDSLLEYINKIASLLFQSQKPKAYKFYRMLTTANLQAVTKIPSESGDKNASLFR